jgi:multiple sugar transport system ATP-binding protein
MATLSISRLHKRFGSVEVLKGIDLEARTGEFIALVGPSGCGKSTLLAMIAGLETVSQGEIRIDGNLVNSVAPKDRDIAMVFQSYALYPTMTARQNITFGMESRGVLKAEQDVAVKRVSALLQIEPLLNRKPGNCQAGSVSGWRWAARSRPQAFSVRRAPLQSRRQAARGHAHRNQEAASAGGQDDRLCHA